MKLGAFLSYQSVKNDDSRASRCISLNLELIKNFEKKLFFRNQVRMKPGVFLSYQSVINDDLSALRCISLNFKSIQNFMIFVILLVSMGILLAHVR